MSTIYAGSLLELSISCVLSDICLAHPSLQWAVIRSIDSSTTRENLQQIFKLATVECTVDNSNIILSRISLGDAIEKDMFSGYDELWLFEDYPTSIDLADEPSATSDVELFVRELPDELRAAILRVGCRLLLADGMGLNFATPDIQIAATLKQLGES